MSRFGKKPEATQQKTDKVYDYQNILDVREQEVTDKQTGKKKSKVKIQLAKGVTIAYNGQEINLGEYNSFFLQDHDDLAEGLDRREAAGGLTLEKRQEEESRINEKKIMYVARVKVT